MVDGQILRYNATNYKNLSWHEGRALHVLWLMMLSTKLPAIILVYMISIDVVSRAIIEETLHQLLKRAHQSGYLKLSHYHQKTSGMKPYGDQSPLKYPAMTSFHQCEHFNSMEHVVKL